MAVLLAMACKAPLLLSGSEATPDSPSTPDVLNIPDIVATVDEPIDPVTRPRADFGADYVAYELTLSSYPAYSSPRDGRKSRQLPGGLRISDYYFVLSGTPTTPMPTTTYVWRACRGGCWTQDGERVEWAFTITIMLPITDPLTAEIEHTYSGRGNEVFLVNPAGEPLAETPYTLQLGDTDAEVYVISTNTNVYDTNPRIDMLGRQAATGAQDIPRSIAAHEGELRDHARGPTDATAGLGLSASSPAQDTERESWQAVAVGETSSFWVDCRGGSIIIGDTRPSPVCRRAAATARRVVTDGTVTLVVWLSDHVADPAFAQKAIDEMAGTFLSPGNANDIYDWVSAIFGKPWGPHNDAYRLPPQAANHIHVLIYDATDVGGYFSAGDTDVEGAIPNSKNNARLMFYVHAGLSIDNHIDVWAHEFVHMIEHYQTRVKRSVDRIALDEVAPLVTEVLIADKIGIEVLSRRRLAVYNCYNHMRFTNAWVSYSLQYALGLYLAHNYGVSLFGNITRNSEESWWDALEAELQARGHSASFRDVLANWGVATLLSDDPQAPYPYRYNSLRTSVVDGVTFRVAPVNLYDYERAQVPRVTQRPESHVACRGGHGPLLFSLREFNAEPPQVHESNRYVSLGRYAGTVRLSMTAEYGHRFTVVVKE